MKNTLKYTLILLCGCAVLMPAGCGTQPLNDIDTPQDVIDAKNPADVAPDVTPGTETLTVSIEPSGSIATKTTYDSVDGKFAWSEGDWIAIHYSNGEYVRGTIQADGTEGSKVVTVTPPANATRDYYALYPYGMLYNSSVRLDTDMTDNYGNPDLYVQFLSGCYDLVETMGGYGSFDEVPCPLVARNDPESGVLLFRHVGGLLHVKMPLLDQNSVCVVFTFDKDVTGIYKVADPDTDHPTVTTKGTTTNNEIWVHLDGSGNGMGCRSSSEPVSINIALPCGTYNNIKVEILSSEPNQVQESATIPHLTITRGHGKRISFADFCDRQLTDAYVPGKFSVSPTKSVYFASGNLLVENTLTNGVNVREWKFEDAQYKSSGVIPPSSEVPHDGGYSKEDVTRGISHFGWATAGVKNGNNAYGYDPHHIYYEPHSLGVFATLYDDNKYGFGPSVSGEFWAGTLPNVRDAEDNSWNKDDAVRGYCDWGIHFDDSGSGSDEFTDGSWYTLSSAEWGYLLDRRSRDNDYMHGLAQIYVEEENETVNGLIILPDNWALPGGCTFSAAITAYTDNKYTTGTSASGFNGLWSAMEAAGAVFLPAVGYRYVGSSPEKWKSVAVGGEGSYWSSSAADQFGGNGSGASRLYFDYEWVGSQGMGNRYHGCSVRLVHD